MDTFPDKDQQVPASVGHRRRTKTVIGLVLLVLILGALIWFGVTHSETRDEQAAPIVLHRAP